MIDIAHCQLPTYGSSARKWKDNLTLVCRSKLKFFDFGPIKQPTAHPLLCRI